MRKKKFCTSKPSVVKSAIAKGYKIVSMAYWIGSPARTFFLEKQNYLGKHQFNSRDVNHYAEITSFQVTRIL